MSETGQRFAFISPQGTYVLKDDLYLKRQGSTAENGGQIIYEIEMARAMAEQGHQVDIFARNYESRELEIEIDGTHPNVRIFHIPTQAPHIVEKEEFYPFYAEYLGRLIDTVEKDGGSYDAIFGHYSDGMTMAAGLERHLAKKRGRETPLIGVTHSLGLQKAEALHSTLKKSDPRPDPETLRAKFNEAVKRFNIEPRLGCELSALAHLDGVVCISHAHKKLLLNDYGYPEDQMPVIPNGVNQSIFRKMDDVTREEMVAPLALARPDIPASTLDLMQNGKIVFGFGRLVKAKGVQNAVKAMEEVLGDHPDAVYVYAGGNIPAKSAEEKEVFESCMQHAHERGYADRIVFLGRQDQSVIARWLNVADVYLHCASLEPFGLAPIEAAATGVPCVISGDSGVAEVLEHDYDVLHTDPQSPVDIAKQVGRVLANPALGQRLAAHATHYVREYATWSARATEIVSFIDNELKPNYFRRRAQREHNGNMYLDHARALIDERDLSGLEEDFSAQAEEARQILDTMLQTGLPESHSQHMKLQY